MIENNLYKTYFSRIILYIIASFGFLFVNYDSFIYEIIQMIFVILLIGDTVLEILIIIKNFDVLKLVIVILNSLLKLILVITYLSEVFSIVSLYDILPVVYLAIVIPSIIAYPVLIILFMINTYKEEIIKVDKPLFLVLFSGSVMFVYQFFLPPKFVGQLDGTTRVVFYFSYALIIIFVPIIFITFVYTSTLFFKDEKQSIVD